VADDFVYNLGSIPSGDGGRTLEPAAAVEPAADEPADPTAVEPAAAEPAEPTAVEPAASRTTAVEPAAGVATDD